MKEQSSSIQKERLTILSKHKMLISFFVITLLLISFDMYIKYAGKTPINIYIYSNNLVSKSLDNINKINSYFLISSSIFSLLISEVLHKYITNSRTKLLGIDPKPYAKIYSNYTRFFLVLILVLFACVLESRLALLFIESCIIIYCLNILMINDYTLSVKNGIKKGYFINIGQKKNKIYFLSKSNMESINEANSILLERLIISSLKSRESKKILKRYDTLKFNIDILNDFYNDYLNKKNVGIFIHELKKSLETFFIFEIKDNDGFDFYLNSIVNDIFKYNDEQHYYYNALIYCSLIFVISGIPFEDENEASIYLNVLKNNISIELVPILKIVTHVLYMMVFFKMLIDEPNNQKLYEHYKNEWQDYLSINTSLNKDEEVFVWEICINIIENLYHYSDKTKNRFRIQYLHIYSVIDKNIDQALINYNRRWR